MPPPLQAACQIFKFVHFSHQMGKIFLQIISRTRVLTNANLGKHFYVRWLRTSFSHFFRDDGYSGKKQASTALKWWKENFLPKLIPSDKSLVTQAGHTFGAVNYCWRSASGSRWRFNRRHCVASLHLPGGIQPENQFAKPTHEIRPVSKPWSGSLQKKAATVSICPNSSESGFRRWNDKADSQTFKSNTVDTFLRTNSAVLD